MGLLTHNADGMGGGTLQNMIMAFESIGYHVEWNILKSTDFGLPQKRERVFIIGSRDGETGLIPDDGSDALGHPTRKPPTFGTIRGTENPKPWARETYRTALSKVQRTGVEIAVVDDDDILPTITCGWGGGATRKKVAIADVTADGIPYLRHPGVEEGARAQGFPDEWEWPKSESDAWTLIGNAVSSPVSRAIAEHLVGISRGEKPKSKKVLPQGRVATYVKEYHGGTTPTINFGG
jgi:DNA (cytosine-5)-methyltransferase 1